jgi:hypothetical protein
VAATYLHTNCSIEPTFGLHSPGLRLITGTECDYSSLEVSDPKVMAGESADCLPVKRTNGFGKKVKLDYGNLDLSSSSLTDNKYRGKNQNGINKINSIKQLI